MIVYKITSPSGKCYIGMTKGKFETRWKQHLAAWRKLKRRGVTNYRGEVGCPVLFWAFDRYDPDTWTHEILHTAGSYEECCEMEIHYIKLYDTVANGYNVLHGGLMGNAGRELSEEHKQAQSEAATAFWQTPEGLEKKRIQSERLKGNAHGTGHRSDKTKKAISDSLKGRKIDEDHRSKISTSAKSFWSSEEGHIARKKLSDDRKDWKLSPEHIEALRQANLGRPQTDYQKSRARDANSKRWSVTHPDGRVEEIVNLRQFCKDHGLSQGNLVTAGKTKGYKAVKLD